LWEAKEEDGGLGVSIARSCGAPILSLLVRQRLRPLVSKERREVLAVLQGFIEAGKVTPLIDRAYPLGEAPEAIRYLAAGHARGKIVITV